MKMGELGAPFLRTPQGAACVPREGVHSGPGPPGPPEAKGLPGWPEPGKVPGAGVRPLLACGGERASRGAQWV